jgi:hypothetical protein
MTKYIHEHSGQTLTFRYLECIPNLLLSPQFHLDTDTVDSGNGAMNNAGADGQMAWACAQGMLKTGDGTREHPYLVLRRSDEYDLFQWQWEKKVASAESVAENDGRHLNHLRSTDGRDYWFDESVVFKYGGKKLAAQAGTPRRLAGC